MTSVFHASMHFDYARNVGDCPERAIILSWGVFSISAPQSGEFGSRSTCHFEVNFKERGAWKFCQRQPRASEISPPLIRLVRHEKTYR